MNLEQSSSSRTGGNVAGVAVNRRCAYCGRRCKAIACWEHAHLVALDAGVSDELARRLERRNERELLRTGGNTDRVVAELERLHERDRELGEPEEAS